MTQENIEGRGRGKSLAAISVKSLFGRSKAIKGKGSRSNQHVISFSCISNLTPKGLKELLQRCIQYSEIKYTQINEENNLYE